MGSFEAPFSLKLINHSLWLTGMTSTNDFTVSVVSPELLAMAIQNETSQSLHRHCPHSAPRHPFGKSINFLKLKPNRPPNRAGYVRLTPNLPDIQRKINNCRWRWAISNSEETRIRCKTTVAGAMQSSESEVQTKRFWTQKFWRQFTLSPRPERVALTLETLWRGDN